jgi:glutaredoxin
LPQHITVYTKPGCCLCDKALEVLEAFAREHPVEIEKIDISKDPALAARYGTRIPVVAVDGVERFEYKVSLIKLRRLAAGNAVK